MPIILLMKIKIKKVKLSILISILIIVDSFALASSVNEPNYTANMTDEELVKEYQKSYWGEHPISKKYLYDVLYVGMLEEEFINKFTKDLNYEGTDRPYIYKKINNIYYITFPKLPYLLEIFLVSRITFKNGLLTKYECRYLSKLPFIMYVYGDYTFRLKIKEGDKLVLPKDNADYFDSMSEKELLNEISSDDFFQIVSQQIRKTGNFYIIQAKSGVKWKVQINEYGVVGGREYLKENGVSP